MTPVHVHDAGGLAVTAGGTSLCVWDMMAGGRLLQRLSQHQKTVTCVVLSPLAGPDSAAAPRMLSGSLDGHVKVCTAVVQYNTTLWHCCVVFPPAQPANCTVVFGHHVSLEESMLAEDSSVGQSASCKHCAARSPLGCCIHKVHLV